MPPIKCVRLISGPLKKNFSDAGINQTLLTMLALSPYFRKIQDISYTIMSKLEYLQSEVMPNNSENLLQDLAIRYIAFV